MSTDHKQPKPNEFIDSGDDFSFEANDFSAPPLVSSTMEPEHVQIQIPSSIRLRSARRVIYLDFDGVLHHEAVYLDSSGRPFINPQEAPVGSFLFQWAPMLDKLLRGHTDIAIVLSTSWVYQVGAVASRTRLPEGLSKRIIGATFNPRIYGKSRNSISGFSNRPRGVQVVADAHVRQPQHWVALDDNALAWPPSERNNLIHCRGDLGLSDVVVQAKLTRWLSHTY